MAQRTTQIIPAPFLFDVPYFSETQITTITCLVAVYHKAEATVKLRILGIGKKVHVRKMDEDTAIELASEMLGEVIVFVVATATLYFEYRRQCRKEIMKEETQNDRLTELEEVIVRLQGQITEQSSQIKQIKHMLEISNSEIPETITDKKSGLVLRVEKKNKQLGIEIV